VGFEPTTFDPVATWIFLILDEPASTRRCSTKILTDTGTEVVLSGVRCPGRTRSGNGG
jgi:hypothetical protein